MTVFCCFSLFIYLFIFVHLAGISDPERVNGIVGQNATSQTNGNSSDIFSSLLSKVCMNIVHTCAVV